MREAILNRQWPERYDAGALRPGEAGRQPAGLQVRGPAHRRLPRRRPRAPRRRFAHLRPVPPGRGRERGWMGAGWAAQVGFKSLALLMLAVFFLAAADVGVRMDDRPRYSSLHLTPMGGCHIRVGCQWERTTGCSSSRRSASFSPSSSTPSPGTPFPPFHLRIGDEESWHLPSSAALSRVSSRCTPTSPTASSTATRAAVRLASPIPGFPTESRL